jgi:aminopeptidase N
MYKAISFFVLGLMSCLLLKAQTPAPAFYVQHYRFAIQLNDVNDSIKGQAKVRIRFLKDVSSFQLDLAKPDKGKGMLISAVTEDDKTVPFTQQSETVSINVAIKANSVHSYTIIYQGIPSDGLIISTNKFGHRTFFWR